ncbi:MAG TPA: 2Fe-2S iron-sulfur cluster-binding protein, partial [Burkholderiales bacterium]|nr:2Fe-2S iron-sulfur cluster-binding protein [Burkholderiales bacterium]
MTLRNLRLVTGLVLMLFVTGHMANLMLGMHSLEAMERWRPWLMGPWRSLIGQGLLVCSALIHLALGIYAITARRSLAMSKTDVVQLFLGLATPPLLLNHAIVMHMAGEVTPNFDATFGQMLAVYWSFSPGYAIQQVCVVMVVWIHAALGLYSWLVLKPLWRRIGGLVLPVLFAVPILALVGFAEAGKEVLDKLANDPAWLAHIRENLRRVVAITDPLNSLQNKILLVYGALVLVALGILATRMLRERNRVVNIAYDEGFTARGRRGLSILELSRTNDVPHAHVCSGRGRCGTCRVRIESGAEQLSAASESERATLERLGAGVRERLACQANANGPGIAVTRVLPP